MDSLLKNAVRVYLSPQRGHVHLLGWQTDTTQLAMEWPSVKKLANGQYLFRYVAIELPSGKRRPLGEFPQGHLSGIPSPDGKWFLSDPLNHPTEVDLTAVTLDGKQKRHWALNSDRWILAGSKPLWIANGTAWAMLVFQGKKLYALTGSLLGGPSTRIIPLGTSSDATGAYGVWIDTIILGHLIESPDGDLIRGIGRSNDGKTNTAQLWRWEFRLSQGQRSRKETPFEVPFPKGEWATDIAYSPRTKRLAVLTRPFQTDGQWSVHTMALDGSQRVCLGTITSRYQPRSLEWLPSGTKLSFEHDDALWVVPDAPPKHPQIL